MNNYDDNIFTILKSKLQLPIGHKKTKKIQSLLDFLEDEATEKVSIKKNSVWNEEPTFKAIRKNNFKWFCFLIVLGGKLQEDDFKYLVNKIEDESEKFAKKTYLIKFLSKIRDQFDQTLIHHAAFKGKLKCLKILIGCKSNENKRKTEEEQTSCLFACKNGETKCDNTLFGNVVSVNVYNLERKTPLFLAAGEGHQECVELLIRKGGDVNAKDENDCTPLHLSAWYGKFDCLEVLLANGADVDARNNEKETPLHIAAKQGHHECAKLLISNGADLNAKDENDRSPLHYAAAIGKVNCLEVLLANGADVNARNNNKWTAVHMAAKQGHHECAKLLISKGADVNANDANDCTPLHISAWYGKFDCLEVLLANEANVNARTNKLNTPLHITGFSPEGSKEEKERCAEMLINAGADVDAKDKDGNTIFYHPFFHTLRVERPDLFIKKTKRKFI